ncbi:hypothetical protein QQX98_006209 [Neonectria punicea]|uniref:DUF7703 domain-containing protein n=1 Tax=Neonectria punicea TaxID=979145 RepID=A0ABR1H2Z0_9HYPO
MTIAGLFAVACYNCVEILISLLNRFKRHDGLYFWSMLTATLGIVLHSIVVLLRYYSLGPNFLLCVLTCIGWYGMVTGQSVVLYSRLHLIIVDRSKTRWILIMIITNFCILHIPVTVLFLGSNTKASQTFLPAFNVYERIQLAGFFIQETIISGLYIWETARDLKPIFAVKGAMGRNLIRHLIIVNILVILLDISLLVTQYLSHFQIQTTYKPVVYSIKLKMEFIALNKLLLLVQHHECNCLNAADDSGRADSGRADARPSFLGVPKGSFARTLHPRRFNDEEVQLHDVSSTLTNDSSRTGSRGLPRPSPFTFLTEISTGFYLQDQLHDSTQTIHDAFELSALLRQEASISHAQKRSYVDKIMDLWDGINSLSAERRKRLPTRVGFAAKPSLSHFLRAGSQDHCPVTHTIRRH